METTLNINTAIFEKITTAAHLKGISRSKLIIILIKKVMDDIPEPGRFGTLVRYQKKCKPDDWHVFHVRVRMDDYEYLLDLRKLLKMSVSLILSYAVMKFLNKFLNRNNTDNYQYSNYVIIKDMIDNIPYWKLIWGYPPNLEKILP
jgi:hypothetical protein